MVDRSSDDGSAQAPRPVVQLNSLGDPHISELIERDEFFWLDLDAPSDDDLHRMGETFGIHPLAVEDSIHFEQRPKLDEYGDTALLVFYSASKSVKGMELTEHHLHISGSWVITIRRRRCPVIESVRDTLARVPMVDEGHVLYRILDGLTDSYFPVIEALDEEIDDVEDRIVHNPAPELLERIFTRKRQLVHLRRVVAPQRDLLAHTIDRLADIPGLHISAHDWFRDVYDHMLRVSDMIDVYRDLLTGAMEVQMSSVASRQNDVMKDVSVIATIFLPLTFITGFFGQNFAWMVRAVDTRTDFLVFGVGGLLVSVIALLMLFRRRGYL